LRRIGVEKKRSREEEELRRRGVEKTGDKKNRRREVQDTQAWNSRFLPLGLSLKDSRSN
jgi:hypothetical protein